MKLSARDLAAVTGGRLERPGESGAAGVSTDSRSLQKGDVFFALKGPSFDGHAFLSEAVAKGAAGLVVEDGALLPPGIHDPAMERQDFFLLRVRDTLRALGDTAAECRRRYQGKVVAVTGSNGKTTTKEMIASILGVRWKTGKSPGNFNNLIGVPLSIFKAREEQQALVLEAGMNRPGEIARLTDIASPDVGVITCIAPAHLENLRDIGGIKEAKGELLERMKASATAVLNADDPNVMSLRGKFGGRVLTFGLRAGADVRAERMVARAGGGTAFDLITAGGGARVVMDFIGRHNIGNALAASAAAGALGFDPGEIQKGLAECRPLPLRLELIALPGGIKVVSDVYNANPGSVVAAVEALRTIVHRGCRYVLLGDMLELGDYSGTAHEEVGRIIAEGGVDMLVTVGRETEAAVRAFDEAATGQRKGRHFARKDEAVSYLVKEMKPGDLVLVKGSRGMNMEKAVEALREQLAAAGGSGA